MAMAPNPLYYDPSIGAAASNIAAAIFGNPDKAAQYDALQSRSDYDAQKTADLAHAATARNALQQAILGFQPGDPNSARAIAANQAGAGTLSELNNALLGLTANTGGTDAQNVAALVGAGKTLGKDDAVSLPGQEAIRSGNFGQETAIKNSELANALLMGDRRNATDLSLEGIRQAGDDRRMHVETSPGSVTTLPENSPLGVTTIHGPATPDTVKGGILANYDGAGGFADPNEPLVPFSPLAIAMGATGQEPSGKAEGKNWAAPGTNGNTGAHGVTYDGHTNSDGTPLPQGWQYSTEVNQGGTKLKVIPSGAVQSMLGNKQTIDNIDKTIVEMAAHPGSTGWKGFASSIPVVGNNALNALDPTGVNGRANIANIGSLIIHDRSGAAVTISETPRLVPFIPLVTDSESVVKTKMQRLRAEILSMLTDQNTSYSEDGGYIQNPAIGSFLQGQQNPADPAPVDTGMPKSGEVVFQNGHHYLIQPDGSGVPQD